MTSMLSFTASLRHCVTASLRHCALQFLKSLISGATRDQSCDRPSTSAPPMTKCRTHFMVYSFLSPIRPTNPWLQIETRQDKTRRDETRRHRALQKGHPRTFFQVLYTFVAHLCCCALSPSRPVPVIVRDEYVLHAPLEPA